MQKTRLRVIHHPLNFKVPAQTSRDILKSKDTYFLQLTDENIPGKIGYGECAPIWGLSVENKEALESKLLEVSENPDVFISNKYLLKDYPALLFGLETAQLDLNSNRPFEVFSGPFFNGEKDISINGLIWMGDLEYMMSQLETKLEEGFSCIKLKIGAIDFNEELQLLSVVRNKYDSSQVILRVDANGAFTPEDCETKLRALSAFDLHSIEQPIKQGQWKFMADLCKKNIVPIALDEELIGINDEKQMVDLLDEIKPQYLVLKPSLLGGFNICELWIKLASQRNIGWWITSALESNVGLNAIAQWTAKLDTQGHQGLGTGGLYLNNINSPLEIHKGMLHYDRHKNWGSI